MCEITEKTLGCSIPRHVVSWHEQRCCRRGPQHVDYVIESLCQRSLESYSDVDGFELCHYRDDKDREIDAIVEKPDGSWGAVEIGIGFDQVEKATEHCSRYRRDSKNNRHSSVLYADWPP